MKKTNARETLLDVTFEEVYIHGYAATSIDAILKKAGVPKGSLYHHFGSKKSLVLAMIRERLFVKIDQFFIFEKKEDESVMRRIRSTYAAMAKNRPLITYGCPLYRLMVELSPVDREFDILLLEKYEQQHHKLALLLREGIEEGEFNTNLEPESFARYLLSATWGILSLSPTLSSPASFLEQSAFLLKQLESYRA